VTIIIHTHNPHYQPPQNLLTNTLEYLSLVGHGQRPFSQLTIKVSCPTLLLEQVRA